MGNGAKQPKSKRTANLKPRWKKGQSGNPNGRPPKPVCIPDILREIGAEKDPATKRTRIQDLMRKVYGFANDGEAWAVQFIAERTEGKVKDTLALEGGGELKVVTRVVRERAADADGR